MLQFFYDSLDTLKKVKQPTVKEVRFFAIMVFVVVIIASILFVALDTIWSGLYTQIFQTFSGQ